MKLSTKSLYIVSTPIGNLDDITIRAIEVLKNSDIILCEDTRHSLKLLNHLKIKKQLISYHKFNEKKELEKIIKYLNEGKILSLISDAGTPSLSDPGRLLIQTCVEKNIKVVPTPLTNKENIFHTIKSSSAICNFIIIVILSCLCIPFNTLFKFHIIIP